MGGEVVIGLLVFNQVRLLQSSPCAEPGIGSAHRVFGVLLTSFPRGWFIVHPFSKGVMLSSRQFGGHVAIRQP